MQSHESDPRPESERIPLGNSIFDSSSVGNDDDLDILINGRKRFRSCTTRHAIANFISYEGLSLNYRTFVANLSAIEIPKNWKEAFKEVEWKKAIDEEMNALMKNKKRELTSLPAGKQPVRSK